MHPSITKKSDLMRFKIYLGRAGTNPTSVESAERHIAKIKPFPHTGESGGGTTLFHFKAARRRLYSNPDR